MTAIATTQPALDDLLDHAGWLRRLATGLVHDSGEAEDLAQEVFLVAARERPADLEHPRAWLAAVARKLAFTQARSRARRVEREQTRPTQEPGHSTDELVAEAELGRTVAQLVLELDEPYRTVLLMRYWRDLPPRKIATELERPVETIKVQLRRGVEQLRERLDVQHGDRSTWAALLIPLASPRSAAALPLGIAALVATGILCGLAVLAGVLRLPGNAGPDSTLLAAAPTATASLEAAPAAQAPLAAQGSGVPGRGSARVPAAPDPVTTVVAAEVTDAEVEAEPLGRTLYRGCVRGLTGQPIAGVLMEVRPEPSEEPTQASPESPGTGPASGAGRPQGAGRSQTLTGPDGRFELPASQPHEVRCASDSHRILGWVFTKPYAATLKGAQAPSSTEHAPTDPTANFFTAEAVEIVTRLRDEAGQSVSNQRLAFSSAFPSSITSHMPLGWGMNTRVYDTVQDAAGLSRTVLPCTPVWVRWPREDRERMVIESLFIDGVEQPVGIDAGAEYAKSLTLDLTAASREVQLNLILRRQPASTSLRVTGEVVRPDGAPASGAQIVIGNATATTDAEGRFDFEASQVQADDALVVFEPGRGLLLIERPQDRFRAGEQELSTGVLILPAEKLSISGRLVDASGAPLVAQRFSLVDPTHLDALPDTLEAHAGFIPHGWRYTGPDGLFAIHGLLLRDYTIQIHLSEDVVQTFGPFPAGTEELRLVIDL